MGGGYRKMFGGCKHARSVIYIKNILRKPETIRLIRGGGVVSKLGMGGGYPPLGGWGGVKYHCSLQTVNTSSFCSLFLTVC